MNKRDELFTYVDLFSGAGGFSLGFDKAEFENIFSIEINSDFAETYKKNFPNHNLLIEDIKDVTENQINNLVKEKKVDVIVGGPPCQGFSLAGNIGRTFLEDERNSLFKEFVRFVDILKPKVFVMENVAAMATHQKGKTINEIIKALENSGNGYKIDFQVLNSVNYEIAQERRRIFIIGVSNNINSKFYFPETSNKIITVKDVIGNLPKLQSGQASLIPNHTAMNHSKQMLEKMKYIKDGGNRLDIPEELRPKSGDIRKYIRYASNKPSICITGDMRKVFHYEQNRALTARELARIQSFPDNFIFQGTSLQIQQQIGNAVPPKLAYLIALQVKEVLDYEKVSESKLYRK